MLKSEAIRQALKQFTNPSHAKIKEVIRLADGILKENGSKETVTQNNVHNAMARIAEHFGRKSFSGVDVSIYEKQMRGYKSKGNQERTATQSKFKSASAAIRSALLTLDDPELCSADRVSVIAIAQLQQRGQTNLVKGVSKERVSSYVSKLRRLLDDPLTKEDLREYDRQVQTKENVNKWRKGKRKEIKTIPIANGHIPKMNSLHKTLSLSEIQTLIGVARAIGSFDETITILSILKGGEHL